MATFSTYEEDQQNPSSSSSKPFNALLDPSNPLAFLETVFDIVSRGTDLFESDYGVGEVNALVRKVKEKVDNAKESSPRAFSTSDHEMQKQEILRKVLRDFSAPSPQHD